MSVQRGSDASNTCKPQHEAHGTHAAASTRPRLWRRRTPAKRDALVSFFGVRVVVKKVFEHRKAVVYFLCV